MQSPIQPHAGIQVEAVESTRKRILPSVEAEAIDEIDWVIVDMEGNLTSVNGNVIPCCVPRTDVDAGMKKKDFLGNLLADLRSLGPGIFKNCKPQAILSITA